MCIRGYNRRDSSRGGARRSGSIERCKFESLVARRKAKEKRSAKGPFLMVSGLAEWVPQRDERTEKKDESRDHFCLRGPEGTQMQT